MEEECVPKVVDCEELVEVFVVVACNTGNQITTNVKTLLFAPLQNGTSATTTTTETTTTTTTVSDGNGEGACIPFCCCQQMTCH